MPHCDISVSISEKTIDNQKSMCPNKYAPLSPKNIFGYGKLKNIKPESITNKTSTISDICVSGISCVTKYKTDKIIIESKIVNPFKPSIKLNELITPEEANTVKNIANTEKFKSVSKKKIEVVEI